jgi:hypothetical protein
MTCPHCGKDHPSETQFCPETGQPIPQAGAPVEAQPAAFPGGPQHVEPKSIGEHISGAFELYKKHFVALVITCGIAIVPIGLISAALQRAAAPSPATTAALEGRSNALKAKSRQLRELQGRMTQGSEAEQRAAHEQAQQLQREITADTQAMMNDAGGLLASVGASLIFVLLLLPLQAIAAWLAQGALIPITGDRALGGQMEPGKSWSLTLAKLGPLLITSILGAIAVGVGTLLCLIPGLVLAFLFSFSSPVVMLEDKSGVDALKRSAQLVKDHWLPVVVIDVVFGVLIGLAGWVVGRVTGVVAGTYLHPIVTAVLFPLPMVALLHLYLDLRRVDEGVNEADLRAKMVGQ